MNIKYFHLDHRVTIALKKAYVRLDIESAISVDSQCSILFSARLFTRGGLNGNGIISLLIMAR